LSMAVSGSVTKEVRALVLEAALYRIESVLRNLKWCAGSAKGLSKIKAF